MDEATEKDVALDVVAALDMYEGLCGSESTVIDEVGLEGLSTRTILLVLSNGQRFRLNVAEMPQ